MEFATLFVLDDAAKRLRDGIKKRGLANTGVTDQSNLKPEMIVVIVLARRHHLVSCWELAAAAHEVIRWEARAATAANTKRRR